MGDEGDERHVLFLNNTPMTTKETLTMAADDYLALHALDYDSTARHAIFWQADIDDILHWPRW